jgi:hypothetical protein
MDDRHFKHCKEIKQLLESQLFNSAVREIKKDLATQLFASKDNEGQIRIDLYYENKALDRILDKLQSYANEIVMIGEPHG